MVDMIAKTLDTAEPHDEEGLERAETSREVDAPIAEVRRPGTRRLQVRSRDAEGLLEETLVRSPASSPSYSLSNLPEIGSRGGLKTKLVHVNDDRVGELETALIVTILWFHPSCTSIRTIHMHPEAESAPSTFQLFPHSLATRPML